MAYEIQLRDVLKGDYLSDWNLPSKHYLLPFFQTEEKKTFKMPFIDLSADRKWRKKKRKELVGF